MRIFSLLMISTLLLSACAEQPTPISAPSDNAAFIEWLENVKQEAQAQGIALKTVEDAFDAVAYNDRVIELDQKQPESTMTQEQYLAKVISAQRIARGREMFTEHRALLDEVSAKYGVPPQYIVALWGIETSYGNNTGGFSVVESLATLAYDGRRSEYFRSELMNALKILDDGHIAAYDMTGSWAGAMGQCQFMPGSFLSYAEDYDGDGKRDIWNTTPDIFASIANYLKRHGWNNDRDNNFNVLLKWNRSRYFATAVMQLADSIGK